MNLAIMDFYMEFTTQIFIKVLSLRMQFHLWYSKDSKKCMEFDRTQRDSLELEVHESPLNSMEKLVLV